MDSDVSKQSTATLIRLILVAVGGGLTRKGLVDSATVDLVVGVVMIVLPAIWELVERVQHQLMLLKAVNAGINLSNIDPNPTPQMTTVADAKTVINHYGEVK